jgi:hypothetical protein
MCCSYQIEGGLDFDCLANGKKSLAVNVKHPKGAEILRRICKKSDVFIEPFRRGIFFFIISFTDICHEISRCCMQKF